MNNLFKSIFNRGEGVYTDLIVPFNLTMRKADFVNFKTAALYKKILTRCFNKTKGFNDEQKVLSLFDSAEQSNARFGLITKISFLMTEKAKECIVYDSGIVRKATIKEQEKIEKDYEKKASSTVGILVNFQKYTMTDVIKMYMGFIYDIFDCMNTNLGVARSLQIKISNMRSTISANAVHDPKEQAQRMVEGVKSGKAIMLDALDMLEQTQVNTDSVKNAILLVAGQLASEIGVPLSFVIGELSSGMAVTGEADANAEEQGIRDFWTSIFKPIVSKLYDVKIEFKTDNWRKIKEYAQTIPFIESSLYLSEEQKEKLVNDLFEG